MTREMHAIILKAALRLLLERTDDELTESWMIRENVEWCLENTTYPNSKLEDAMEKIILGVV